MLIHRIANYTDALRTILEQREGRYSFVYTDSNSIPTIGIGINIGINIAGNPTNNGHYDLVLRALGFDYDGRLQNTSPAAWQAEKDYRAQVMAILSSPGLPNSALSPSNPVIASLILNSAVEPISAERTPPSIRSEKPCADQHAMYSEATDSAD